MRSLLEGLLSFMPCPAFCGLVLASALLTASAQEPEQHGDIEARGLWTHLAQVISPDPGQGRQDIATLLDRMALANLNLLLPWVRSEYIGALMDPAYPADNVHAKQAFWDALAELIEAAAERGITTHLWYSFTHYKTSLSHEMRTHPEWAAHRLDEFVPDKETGELHPPWMSDVCNMHAGARQLELDMLEFVLNRYPLLRGVHIEEPGFGYAGNCFCERCNDVFRRVYGFDQQEKPNGPEAADLKCVATTDFMRRLRGALLARDPTLVLSANGGYRWQSDRVSGRDWGHWSRLGWLDYYVPQIYVTDMEVLGARARETLAALTPTSQTFIGFNVSPRSIRPASVEPDELTKVVQTIRGTGARGIVFFWAGAFTDDHARALGRGAFARPARLPIPMRLKNVEQSSLAPAAMRSCANTELPPAWRFRLDPDDEGEAQGWYAPGFDDAAWQDIAVARTWESQGHDYDGYAWYRVSFSVAAQPKGACRVYFGGVDARCWVYLNGARIGEHNGWDQPFAIDVSEAVEAGTNVLAVRVYDGSANGGIYEEVIVYEEPPNLIPNAGFESGLDGWLPSPHASAAADEARRDNPCLKLEGTGQPDSKAGYELKLEKAVTGIVELSFNVKRLARETSALVGITVRFDFSDGTSIWHMEPWRVPQAAMGRWTVKSGWYAPKKPLRGIGVWCINYNASSPALFDDVAMRLYSAEPAAGD